MLIAVVKFVMRHDYVTNSSVKDFLKENYHTNDADLLRDIMKQLGDNEFIEQVFSRKCERLRNADYVF